MSIAKGTSGAGRDRVSAVLLKKLASTCLGKYGRVEHITLDSSRKTLAATILLRGESEHVTLSVSRFEVVSEDGRHHMVVHGVSASREWIDALAREYMEGRALRIPSSIAGMLRLIA